MTGRPPTLIAVFLCALLAIAGCDSGAGATAEKAATRPGAGAQWLKENLIKGNVEPRLTHGLLPMGFYQPNLGPDWTPVPPQTGTLISQSRFIYLMAMGYEVSDDVRYLNAMKRSADFLLARFPDARFPGRWVRAVSPEGKVLNRDFHAYSHAQVILALAHAFKVSGEARYLDAAMHTWLALDVAGVLAGKNALYDLRGLGLAIHAFEALLVLYKATDSKLVRGDLQLLGDYIVGNFFDPQGGYFVEWLTPERVRKPDGEIRPGHSIQIAFLLSRAVDAGLPKSYLEPADRSVSFVARMAARDSRGILPDTVDYQGKVLDAGYHWWSQCELLRGLAHFAMHRSRKDLLAQFETTLATVRELFVDPDNGGWYGAPGAKEQNKGHEWKVGYHVAMMITEIMRLDGARFRSGSEVLL